MAWIGTGTKSKMAWIGTGTKSKKYINTNIKYKNIYFMFVFIYFSDFVCFRLKTMFIRCT